ncbi:ATP-grasp domain-containing protein [Symbioplanes lichenis]|uniref:ATP-grasp domain-containing protein n=1 Tax=Symbioplanes lichenis TaxID=1629072 RepID=UPI0027384E77|nr:hypothetical protein [Actinoplanes lichenis]
MRIALVTSREFPHPSWRDDDTPVLAAELTGRGATVEVLTWDGDDHGGWAAYDAVVLQSPWSMWLRLADFTAWLHAREADGTRLLNPPDVVTLGSDKRYLARLAAAGVPVVPTVTSPTRDQLHDLFTRTDPSRPTLVVKPIASGGALNTGEYTEAELPQLLDHLRRLDEALVQPYQVALDTHRELGVVVLDGTVSHAVTKAPLLRPGRPITEPHPDPQPFRGLTAQHDRVIHQTYAALRRLLVNEPLAIRLDFVLDPASPTGLLLLEAEMVAPVKFLPLFPAQCANVAEAILARAAA